MDGQKWQGQGVTLVVATCVPKLEAELVWLQVEGLRVLGLRCQHPLIKQVLVRSDHPARLLVWASGRRDARFVEDAIAVVFDGGISRAEEAGIPRAEQAL